MDLEMIWDVKSMKVKFNAFGHKFKNMTKEELRVKVEEQKLIINNANNKVYSNVMDYIETLPYKVGDKISCTRFDICWITGIIPEQFNCEYTGMILVGVNPAKKDGTRSHKECILRYFEIDSIKKID